MKKTLLMIMGVMMIGGAMAQNASSDDIAASKALILEYTKMVCNGKSLPDPLPQQYTAFNEWMAVNGECLKEAKPWKRRCNNDESIYFTKGKTGAVYAIIFNPKYGKNELAEALPEMLMGAAASKLSNTDEKAAQSYGITVFRIRGLLN